MRNIRDNPTLNAGNLNANAYDTGQAQAEFEGPEVQEQIRTPSINRSNEVTNSGGQVHLARRPGR